MNNYEYIIASLPDIAADWKPAGDDDSEDSLLEFIRSNLSDKDKVLMETLLKGYDESNLNKEFYTSALSSHDPFIRKFFTFDLNVRNAKVRYLNNELGRPAAQDIFMEPEGEFEEDAKLESVLTSGDILGRERGIDSITMDKIDQITVFDYFDIDAVLGFIAKLKIVERWIKLDEEEGRKMFRKLIEEVRGSYSGVRYEEK